MIGALLALALVAASVGFGAGVRRLLAWTGRGRSYPGDLALTLAWILPEVLVAAHAMIVPAGRPDKIGAPALTVGAVLGSAAANLLVVGLLGVARPGRAGLDAAGRSLASAAILLLVGFVSVAALAIGRGAEAGPARYAAVAVVLAVLLAAFWMLGRGPEREKPPAHDPDAFLAPTREGALGASVLTAASLLVLVYATPAFVERAVPWFRRGEDLPREAYALLVGARTVALGLALALPDLILSARDLRAKEAEPPTPRLLLASAALLGFLAIANLNPDRFWNAFASSLFGAFLLAIFVAGLTIILLLSVPPRPSARWRGAIVAAVAAAGLAFAILMTGR